MAEYAAHEVPPGRLPRFVVVKSPNHYRYQIPDDPYLESVATLKDQLQNDNGDTEALTEDDTVHMVQAALARGEEFDEDDPAVCGPVPRATGRPPCPFGRAGRPLPQKTPKARTSPTTTSTGTG